jgi:oligopeptide/dipeptide ABC transporter ATP-binding protein
MEAQRERRPSRARDALISLTGLRKEFAARRTSAFGGRRKVVAVDDVGFEIRAGSTFGLVGESGSGKSTIARMILKLDRPDAGEVSFAGRGLWQQTKAEERDYRRNVQAVLQDPYGALSPRLKVRDIIGEPLSAQGRPRAEIDATVSRLLETVGLGNDAGHRYPHQFSGGQRQRIAIARALSVEPRLLVLDEPVSALDVSIRAQILMLLREMQERLGLTYLFVGHDLAIVRYVSAVVGVMYFGRMVEIGPADDVLRHPRHPYTQRLVSIASMRQSLGAERLTGDLPNPLAPPSGCHFRMRCAYATQRCVDEVPALREAGHEQVNVRGGPVDVPRGLVDVPRGLVDVPRGLVDVPKGRVACHYFAEIEAGAKAATGPQAERP